MLEKIKAEIEFSKYMLEDEEKAIKDIQEKIARASHVGTIQSLISELNWHKENAEKFKYTLGVLKRIMK